MTVYDEFEKIWKGTVVAYFNVLSQNLSGGTDQTRKISWYPAWGSKQASPAYQSEEFPLTPASSVTLMFHSAWDYI
jgi:hypothetical protein